MRYDDESVEKAVAALWRELGCDWRVALPDSQAKYRSAMRAALAALPEQEIAEPSEQEVELAAEFAYPCSGAAFNGHMRRAFHAGSEWRGKFMRAQDQRRPIATAPDLLEALKDAKEFIENLQAPDPEWDRVLDVCVAAIAKAEGRGASPVTAGSSEGNAKP